MPPAELIDSHCHLDFPELSGRIDEVLGRMADNGVIGAVCVSVRMEDIEGLLRMVERHPQIYATVGMHPDYEEGLEPSVDELIAWASHPKIIAVGETGLDYFRIANTPVRQQERFRRHIRAAIAAGKPLVIHTRDAAIDTINILREEGADSVGGIMHCFTESLETAQAAIEMGFYISFSGILSFKNAENLRKVAAALPLNRLLVETDAPYLAPVPFRGKTNEPGYVVYVAEALAKARGVSQSEIAHSTTNNFRRLFPGTL